MLPRIPAARGASTPRRGCSGGATTHDGTLSTQTSFDDGFWGQPPRAATRRPLVAAVNLDDSPALTTPRRRAGMDIARPPVVAVPPTALAAPLEPLCPDPTPGELGGVAEFGAQHAQAIALAHEHQQRRRESQRGSMESQRSSTSGSLPVVPKPRKWGVFGR